MGKKRNTVNENKFTTAWSISSKRFGRGVLFTWGKGKFTRIISFN